MKTVKINLYSFDELNQTGKDKAIQEHKDFLDNEPISIEENGNLGEFYYNHSESEVIENIQLNRYMFFANGDLARCVTYTGKHEKSGITEFIFKGETIII